jgi:hypothetical protein
MIFNLIKSRQPINYILFPLIVIALWVPAFLSAPPHQFSNLMPLYELFLRLVGDGTVFSLVIGILLVVIEGFILNYIIDLHKILPERNNLVAFFYVIFCSIHPAFLYPNPVIVANLFLILALGQLLRVYNQKNVLKEVFNASMLVGVASLFYFPSLLLIFLIWAACIIIRPFEWRNYIVSLLGPIAIGLWLSTYYFMNDRIPTLILKYSEFNNYSDGWSISGFSFAVLSFLLILAVVAFGSLLKGLNKNTVRVKNLLRIVVVYFVIGGLSFFTTSHDFFSTYSLMLVSFAVYTANYFDYLKRYWVGNTLIIFLILIVLYNNYRLVGLF